MTKVRPELQQFIEAMENKLRQHDKKRGDSWKEESIEWLFDRLKEETNELKKEIRDYDYASDIGTWDKRKNAKIESECIDVANFAMFLWWKANLND